MKLVKIVSIKSEVQTDKKLVFITHKELSEWTGDHYWSLRHKLVAFPVLLWKKIKGFIVRKTLIRKLQNLDIVVGVHWGFVVKNARSYDWVDFHLTDKDTAKGLMRYNTPKILLTSKDFSMPAEFFSSSRKKFKWDLMTVSHNSRRKRLLELVKAIRSLKTLNPDFTCVLLINTAAKSGTRNSIHTEVDFLKYYQDNFNYAERQDIVMLRISYELGLEGVSSNFVYWLMRNSKNFVLFSKAEGSAKVVKEASKFGSHVWLSRSLLGGSIEGMKSSQYTLFDNDQDFINRLRSRFSSNKDVLLGQDYSINAVKELERFLQENSIVKRNECLSMDDFCFADKWLPAHHPDQITNSVTGDKLSYLDIMRFYRDISK